VITAKPDIPKYNIGDNVRIGKTKIELGKKGFQSNWRDKVFKVSSILNTVPVTSYRLMDQQQEKLQGTYLEPELNFVPASI
jgi:hypothetical protein